MTADCSTGPTYIHKGTRRVKKGNTKPRPFWLNVYFIVIKMPACIIIVCVHWNIYLGREQETTQTRHRSSTLYCCFILCHQSPYWRVLNKVIKTFIPVSIFKQAVCYFLFWFEVILSLLFSRKKSKDSLNPGTSNILCCGIGLLGLSHTFFTRCQLTHCFASLFSEHPASSRHSVFKLQHLNYYALAAKRDGWACLQRVRTIS